MSMTNTKQAKRALENEIETRLKQFEADHGVNVTNVQGAPKFERDGENEQVTNWADRISVRCQF